MALPTRNNKKNKNTSIFRGLFDDMPDSPGKRWITKVSEQFLKIPESQITNTLPGSRILPTAREQVLGNIWIYNYNPKTRVSLPYYDKIPLVLIISMNKTSFLGLNFHYLPIEHRLRFFEKLKLIRSTKINSPSARILLTYKLLLENMTKYKEYLPCIKRYLIKHVRSNFVRVPPRDWELSLLLPFYRFKKKPASYVWQQSVDIMRNSLSTSKVNK